MTGTKEAPALQESFPRLNRGENIFDQPELAFLRDEATHSIKYWKSYVFTLAGYVKKYHNDNKLGDELSAQQEIFLNDVNGFKK